MLHAIQGSTFNELATNAYMTVMNDGRDSGSRNGKIRCINNAFMTLTNPRNRHLYLGGRKSNVIAQIAETFWVLAGDDKISPFLDFFLPRAKDYSDDGSTWRGAYGPRLYMYDQLQEAVNVFLTEGLDTRRSVVQILLPELDSRKELYKQDGCEHGNTKDRPCNNELVFFTTPCDENPNTYKLHMNVMQRSGDCIWGALNINVFEWTVLQELVCNTLNHKTDDDVTIVLGDYNHLVTNLHIYEATMGQAEAALSTPQELLNVNNGVLVATNDVEEDRKFFSDIVSGLTALINTCKLAPIEDINCEEAVLATFQNMEYIFSNYGIEMKDNLLWEYVTSVALYILQKHGLTNEVIDGIFGENGGGGKWNPNYEDFDKCLCESSFVKWQN